MTNPKDKAMKKTFSEHDMHYLRLLSTSFPTVAAAATEIINLEAILNLPKGTEHFLADLHGESAAFKHVIKNASGNIRRKVSELFAGDIRDKERRELCTLIYYPEEKLELIKAAESDDLDDWYHITIHRLVAVCRDVSSKYTRSKVRKSLPEDFAYIIEELLHERTDDNDKAAYVSVIVDTIISTGRADDFIIALCNVIQRLSIDQLHILGDIYDRGPGAHIILDTLKQYHSWDIQWGNHDMLWMGAGAGNNACICNVLRLSLRRRRGLRHQSRTAGYLCHGGLRRRPLRGVHPHADGWKHHGREIHPSDGTDAQGHLDYPVQERGTDLQAPSGMGHAGPLSA